MNGANAGANVAANPRPQGTRRTALGYHLARLLRYRAAPLAVLREAFGGELGDRIYQASQMGVLESAARHREPGSARAQLPRVSWRDDMHGDDAAHLRRVAHLALVVLQRCGTETGKAASNKLWLGRTRDGGQYVPAAEQRGLAGLIGVSVRELERYVAVLEAAGVWKCWQPMERDEGAKGVRAPKALPRKLRGEKYAYNHYQLIGPMPRVLRENLLRFYGKGRKSSSPPSTSPQPAALDSSAAGADFADFAADVAALLRGGTANKAPPPS